MHRTEDERKSDDSGGDGQLRWLEKDWAQIDPSPGAIDLGPEEGRVDKQPDGEDISGNPEIFDPLVVDQSSDEEENEAEQNPVNLIPPFRREIGIFTHPASTVDGEHAEDEQRHDVGEEHPVQAEKFAKQWGHHKEQLTRRLV